jgi:hypothetical protein
MVLLVGVEETTFARINTMKSVFLIVLAAVAFVFASVSSNVIIKNIEEEPTKTEEPKKAEEPKKEESPKSEEKPVPVPQPTGPGNLNQPYYPPPPPYPVGPGNL